MIVPMKKCSIVVMDKERDKALDNLRQLGLVHIQHSNTSSKRLQELLEEKSRLEQAKGILRSVQEPAKGKDLSVDSPIDAKTLVSTEGSLQDLVLRVAAAKKERSEAIAANGRELGRIKGWGDCTASQIQELAEHGVELVPYEFSAKELEKARAKATILIASSDKARTRAFSVGAPMGEQGSARIEGFTPFALGELGETGLRSENAKFIHEQKALDAFLLELSASEATISSELLRVDAEIEYEMAKCGMVATEDSPEGLGIAWLSGFVPAEDAGYVKRAAAENGWALLVDDPELDDKVPTKVKSNAFTRLAKPVFNLLGTIPGYREYDISLSFLLFFTLFFAMIFGDAGYGSLMFSGIAILALKSRAKTGKIADGYLLLGLLSLATIVWGSINGNWFAIDMELLPSFLRALVIPPFDPARYGGGAEGQAVVQQHIKHFCFIIATFQLSLAHLKNIKKEFPSPVFLAQVGWLSMVLGLYFLVLNLVLDQKQFPVPDFALVMIGGGILMYFVFVEQKGGNFFVNIGKGFANFLPTFLSAVSSFSDIISYIRLFAVGLAGFAIAESFNTMAMGLPGILAKVLGGVLILFAGHGLNLAMNALSVVVHGVRLNVLEYSGHLNMEWSGFAYKPFARKELEAAVTNEVSR